MISDAKSNNYYYQFIQNFLYFATATASITFSFPGSIPIAQWTNTTFVYNNNHTQTTSWSEQIQDYTTSGYSQTLLKTNQSMTVLFSYGEVQLTPQILSSGSQANLLAYNNTH